jgi:hypothetical protein
MIHGSSVSDHLGKGTSGHSNPGWGHPWRPLVRGLIGLLEYLRSKRALPSFQANAGGSFVVAPNLRSQDALPSLAVAIGPGFT